MTSACAGSSVGSSPSAAWRTSAMRSESYSFIWHPKVRMYTRLAIARLLGVAGDGLGLLGRGPLLHESRGLAALAGLGDAGLRVLRAEDGADRGARFRRGLPGKAR